MKKIEDKIQLIEEQIVKIEKNETLFLNEMKKIGIEKLPYGYSSLKRFIDGETMEVHYTKHYKGYVDKLNDALSKKNYDDLDLEDIIKSISKFNKTIRNNAGGAFNHALFWKMLSPNTQTPKGEILKKIISDFGDLKNFKKEFEDSAKKSFGSGWVWLVLTKRKTLKIMTTPNQDNPLMNIVKNGGYPLLGLDLWEHAYYLKYKNKRDEYIENFWKCVNWEFVNDLYKSKIKKDINESVENRMIINESKSEKCSRQETETIRFIFNVNPKVKHIFRYAIDSILKDVFNENYYESGQYGTGESYGIYDLEGKGRSVINKLNTNYSCFCILLNDVNKVLEFGNKPKINLVGKTPYEQISETKRFVKIIDEYKRRIFNLNSSTFVNLMSTLGHTNKLGNSNENSAVEVLKKKFGDDNVLQIGKLGSIRDMVEGVDCQIVINGKTHTAQIKPFTHVNESDDLITIFGTGQVKPYNTDWIIFTKKNKEVLIFKNKSTKIVNGNYVFPSSDLIYQLD